MKKKTIIVLAGLGILAPSIAMASCGGQAAMRAADTDGSMSLSESEYLNFAKSQFALIDSSKDGQIGIQEYKAFKQACKKGKEKK